VRNTFMRGNVLASLKVPPDIRIGNIARCQGKQAEKDDCQKSALYREPVIHAESIIAGERCAR